jgi:hypothetical protein
MSLGGKHKNYFNNSFSAITQEKLFFLLVLYQKNVSSRTKEEEMLF